MTCVVVNKDVGIILKFSLVFLLLFPTHSTTNEITLTFLFSFLVTTFRLSQI